MHYIGIDIGGTNIAAGLVDESGSIIAKMSSPTGAERGLDFIVEDMADLCQRLMDGTGLRAENIGAVGIGLPGIVSPQEGMVYFCPNLNWRDIPLRDIFAERIDLPVYIGNDANVAAWAERASGVFKGKDNCIFLTLGTGLGGGIILDGKLFTGVHHVGAEPGHMVLVANGNPCNCGNYGCFERYASASALINMAKNALSGKVFPAGEGSLMLEKAGSIEKIDAKCVIDSAKEGDEVALDVFEAYAKYLALGIVSLINLFDPEIIALGGGVSNAGEFLLEAVRRHVRENALFKDIPYADIVIATLGNDAGIIGAAMLGAI
ncbi:MAG: ROK family protein [Christensenellales bacterium]|jgi:glucokinase